MTGDEMLARINERTLNMWHILEEADNSINKKIDYIIEHQKEQNGSIMKNTIYRKITYAIGAFFITVLILHLIGVY